MALSPFRRAQVTDCLWVDIHERYVHPSRRDRFRALQQEWAAVAAELLADRETPVGSDYPLDRLIHLNGLLTRRKQIEDEVFALQGCTVEELASWDLEADERVYGREGDYGPATPRLSGPKWDAMCQQVFRRDVFTCVYCGAHGVLLECDHIVPVSRGGTHDLSNLATACVPCNQAKRDKTPEEWRR